MKMARFNYITKKDALDIRDLKNYEIQEWIPYVAREKTAALVKMITKIKCGPLHTLECGEVHGSPHTFLVRDSRHTTYAIARVSMDETRYKVRSYAIQKQKVSSTFDYSTAETTKMQSVASLLKQIPVLTKDDLLEVVSALGMQRSSEIRGTSKEIKTWRAFYKRVKDPKSTYTTEFARNEIVCSALCDMFKTMQHTPQSFADIQHKHPELTDAFLSATTSVSENAAHILEMEDKLDVVVQKHKGADSVYCTVRGHGTVKFKSPADVPTYIQAQVATIESIVPQELSSHSAYRWEPLEGVGAKFFKQNLDLNFLEAAYLVLIDKTYVEQPHWFLHAEKLPNATN
jgi:mannose-6-phosphate isomerase-like protein (cupin superfamily)